jgi:hypothetical protein
MPLGGTGQSRLHGRGSRRAIRPSPRRITIGVGPTEGSVGTGGHSRNLLSLLNAVEGFPPPPRRAPNGDDSGCGANALGYEPSSREQARLARILGAQSARRGLAPSFSGEKDAKGSRYRVAPKRCCGPDSGDERRAPSVSGFRWVGRHHRRCRWRLGSRRCDRAVRPSVGRSGIHVNW